MLSFFKNRKLLNKQKYTGATLIEYTLIGSLIATMLIVEYRTVGNGYIRIYNNIENGLNEAM